MPSLNTTIELFASIEDAVEVFLVMHRSRYAIAKHAFRQTGQRIYGVIAQESGGTGRVPLRPIMALRCSKLVELVLGYRPSLLGFDNTRSTCSATVARLTSSHSPIALLGKLINRPLQ